MICKDDMVFARKVFVGYEHFCVENHGQMLERVVAFTTKMRKEITNLQQIMESKNKEINNKNKEIESKERQSIDKNKHIEGIKAKIYSFNKNY